MIVLRPRWIALTVVLLATAFAAGAGAASAAPGGSGSRPGAEAEVGGALRQFDSCRRVLSYARGHRRAFNPYRYGGYGLVRLDGGALGLTDESAGKAPAAPAAPAVPDHSATNVQEEGIDEPDLVKTDGESIFVVDADSLFAVKPTGEAPRRIGKLDLWRPALKDSGVGHGLLLSGERLLATTQDFLGGRAVLELIDVSDPSEMRVLNTIVIEGSLLASRLNGSTARVVVGSDPAFPIGELGKRLARERKQRAGFTGSLQKNWLPRIKIRGRGVTNSNRRLASCGDLSRPARLSGLGLLTVLTIDLDRGPKPTDTDTILTHGDIVYSSAEGLYIATERWVARRTVEPSSVSSAIHKFGLEGDSTEYRGSAEVPGQMLSQWSLSEHEGKLRVASTIPRWATPGGDDGENLVTVLAERQAGGGLEQIGQVRGLGPNERVYAVRFIGDVGYVVTFREVDPLYTLDLSSPRRPRVVGELKIPGFSSYLHPIGQDHLIGVGQDADERGRTGAQLSLFDVSDPSRPKRIAQHKFAGEYSYSPVEYDHRAFLYWNDSHLAVLPIEVYRRQHRNSYGGAAALRISPNNEIKQVGKLSHGDPLDFVPISRSLVIGDALYTVSPAGVMASDLETLAERGFTAFPGRDELPRPGAATSLAPAGSRSDGAI